jgi:hypothetical protein
LRGLCFYTNLTNYGECLRFEGLWYFSQDMLKALRAVLEFNISHYMWISIQPLLEYGVRFFCISSFSNFNHSLIIKQIKPDEMICYEMCFP